MHQIEILEFPKTSYESLCMEMRKLISQEKEISAKKEEIKKAILEKCENMDRMEYGIKVSHIKVSGAIDYKRLASEVLGVDFIKAIENKYKKSDSLRIDVRSY